MVFCHSSLKVLPQFQIKINASCTIQSVASSGQILAVTFLMPKVADGILSEIILYVEVFFELQAIQHSRFLDTKWQEFSFIIMTTKKRKKKIFTYFQMPVFSIESHWGWGRKHPFREFTSRTFSVLMCYKLQLHL